MQTLTFRASSRSGVAGALLAALLLFGLWATEAVAQGFMVKPMRIDVTVPAGRTVAVPLEIRNTAGSQARAVDLRLIDLSQGLDGAWKLIETESPSEFSARPWTTLSTARLDIPALQSAEVSVRVSAPANAQGAYHFALIAETPPVAGADGVSVRIRFAIPVIVDIEGRPARQLVKLTGAVMSAVEKTSQKEATTKAALRIENDGRTYSRIKGFLSVEKKLDERWRPVTRFDIPEKAILPGVTLELGNDLKRRLPSGTYRLRGSITVDGRRIPPIENEVEFVGDPTADALAYDTALVLSPDMVAVKILPGATRTTVIKVENPGTDPVSVEMAAATPPTLAGMAMGELLGAELSAEPWTEIIPKQFTLRPGGRQNVRVISRVPQEGVDHANYYGDLVVKGAYKDGQSAGESRSTIHLAYRGLPDEVNAVVEQVSLSEGESPMDFFAQVRLTNIGNVHIDPSAKLLVLNPQGGLVRSINLSADPGALLPLGRRIFGGELNLEKLQPGYYALQAVVALDAGKEARGRQIIQVAMDGSGEDAVAQVKLVDTPGGAFSGGGVTRVRIIRLCYLGRGGRKCKSIDLDVLPHEHRKSGSVS